MILNLVRSVPGAERWLAKAIAIWQHINGLWRYGDWNMFRSVSIEVNQHCNRRCSYCPNVLQPTPARHIEPELYARILDQLSEMRWNGIVDFIFYNEPLLHPDIVLLVQQLKVIVPKCHPRIITNGDHLTVQLMSDLIAAGVERFSVSRHQPIKPGWDARVQDLARRHPGMLSVTDLMDVQEKQGLHTRAGLVPVGRVYVAARCNAPMNCQHIDIDGNLLLCCNDYYRKNVMGNVKESTILEVWRSERFTRIRSDLLRGKPSLAICKNCILRT